MSGTVRGIRIHPVKGEPAVELDSVTVGAEGLDGDRRKGAAVHLVSLQSLARSDDGAAAGQPGPRPAGPAGGRRAGWVGRELQVGSAALRVDPRAEHCLGVYAEVVTPGRVNLGDAVQARG